MAERPLIIPVFLPFLGCRLRCLFCNQKAASEGPPSPSSTQSFIETSLIGLPSNKSSTFQRGIRPRPRSAKRGGPRRKDFFKNPSSPQQAAGYSGKVLDKNRERQIAFYGGSFTAIHREDQISYLKAVQPFLISGLVHSIRISTRPDALDEETLFLLKEYGVKAVEIGAQSMIDEVLFLSKRGHWAEDTVSATRQLKRLGFEVGLQLMIGLPGDTLDRFLQTLDRVIDLKPDFLRIHPTLVLKGAPLENLWRAGRYFPLLLEEAIEWLKRGLLKLENSDIRVARVGLQPTKELERDFLAGPLHPALHQLIDSAIFYDMAEYLLKNYPNGSQAIFLCHPKEISNLRGQRNENILKLKDQFQLREILVQGKNDIPRGTLVLQTRTGMVSMQKRDLYT